MRISIQLNVFTGLLLVAIATSPLEASRESSMEQERWLPETCQTLLDVAGRPAEPGADSSWNDHYREGLAAFKIEDFEQAERSFCRALDTARSFGPRDIRFAETLDELGLVRFMSGDFEAAERLQGAAATEMLLARGPSPGDLRRQAEKSCLSSLATYLIRLGWIYDQQGRGDKINALLDNPHLIIAEAYVPAASLRPRLDWLISQYLLLEAFDTADWLSSFRSSLH